MSSWASQAHAFCQPVCQRLSWLHHWSIPHAHTSGAFSPSEWGPDPQCQAAQVAHWIWWWQCLLAWLQICLIIVLSFRCRCWRFGFVNGQVSYTILSVFIPSPSVNLFYVCSSVHPYFRFWTITWVNVNGFSPNLVCADLYWGLVSDC